MQKMLQQVMTAPGHIDANRETTMKVLIDVDESEV